jgi:hypothetical protein
MKGKLAICPTRSQCSNAARAVRTAKMAGNCGNTMSAVMRIDVSQIVIRGKSTSQAGCKLLEFLLFNFPLGDEI